MLCYAAGLFRNLDNGVASVSSFLSVCFVGVMIDDVVVVRYDDGARQGVRVAV